MLLKRQESLRPDKKARPKSMLFKRYTLEIQRHKEVKVKGRKIYAVSILSTRKLVWLYYYPRRSITRNKVGHFIVRGCVLV